MEGSMFYFIFWGLWIYLTFFLGKGNAVRTPLAAAVLLILIFADQVIAVGSFQVSLSGVLLLLLSYAALQKETRKSIGYFYICSFIVTLAYTAFCLFEIFDPVWLIFKKEWMLGATLGYLAVMLQKSLKGRLFILISGTMQGEILYAFILSKHGFPYQIGGFAYLDAFALTAILLIVWSGIENMGSFFEHSFQADEKGKQKSS